MDLQNLFGFYIWGKESIFCYVFLSFDKFSFLKFFPLYPTFICIYIFVLGSLGRVTSLPAVYICFYKYPAFDTRYFHDLRRSAKCWLNKCSFFRMNWFTDITERQSHCYLTRLKKFNLSDSIGVNSCPFFSLYLCTEKRCYSVCQQRWNDFP